MLENNIKDVQNKIIDIAISLTAEKDFNKLLYKIVEEARNITGADGGTLYLKDGERLVHKIMQTGSMNLHKGQNGEKIDIKAIDLLENNVSAYAAINKKLVNVEDVYQTDLFDFSGPKNFDETTGYQTKSMLVCPLISRKGGDVIGVIQLINALDQEGQLVAFHEEYESIVESLASQAGIAIENTRYIEEIRCLFESFVKVVAKTIDERTPYNRRHSENLAKRMKGFALYINTIQEGPLADVYFTKKIISINWLQLVGYMILVK